MKSYTFIKCNGKLERLYLDRIVYIEAMGNYTKVVTTDCRSFTALCNLKRWEDILPESMYCRIHRGCLVALDHLEAIYSDSVKLRNGTLPLGSHYRRNLLDKLTIIDHELKKEKPALYAA